MWRWIFLLTALASRLAAQISPGSSVFFVTTDPSGACTPSYITQNRTTGILTGCVNGTWTSIGGGGGSGGGSSTYKYASTLTGWTNDGCNVYTGLNSSSAQCADNTSVINTYLASANGVCLFMDVGTGTTGVRGPQGGNICIDGNNSFYSGFVLRNGANATVISNSYSLPSPGTPPTQSGSVTLRNFWINGNFYNQSSSVCSNAGSAPCQQIFLNALVYADVDHLNLVNYCSNSAGCAFGVLIGDTGHAEVNYNNINAGGTENGCDPIHFTGPIGSITAFGNTLQNCGDDGFALNAAEGYGGNIGPVTIDGLNLISESQVMRVLQCNSSSSNNYTVGPISLSNVSGTVSDIQGSAAFILGNTSGCSGTAVQDGMSIKVSHLSLTGVGSNSSNTVGLANIQGLWKDVTFDDWVVNSPTQAIPEFALTQGYTATQVTNLDIRNGQIIRTTAGNAAAYPINILGYAGRLHVGNVDCVDELGQSYSACPQMINVSASGYGEIGAFELSGPVNANQKITNLFANLSNLAGLGNLYGVNEFIATPSATCGTVTGNNMAGTIAASTASSCTVTFGGNAQSNHYWPCSFADWTHPSNVLIQTGGSTTTAIFTGTITSGDTVSYQCGAN